MWQLHHANVLECSICVVALSVCSAQDIKARAAAAAAALTAQRVPAVPRHVDAGSSSSLGGSLGSTSDQQSLAGAERDGTSFERQPRPYSMTNASSGGASSSLQQQQQQQAWRSAPGVAAAAAEDAAASNVSSPLSPAARSIRSTYSDRQQQQQQQYPQRRPSYELEQQPSPSSVPRTSSLRAASVRSDASGHSDRSGPAAAAAAVGVAASPSAATAAAAAPVDMVDAAEFAAVTQEVLQLRREVKVLGEQNQAFVFRIKQLEEFTVSQTAAMRQMQLTVEELQRQQQLVAASVGAGVGGGAGDGVGFSSDGGWYNPGRRMSPRVSTDNLR